MLLLAVMVVYFRDWRLALKALLCGVVLEQRSLAWAHVDLYRVFLFTPRPRSRSSTSRRLRNGAALLVVDTLLASNTGLGAGLLRAALPGLRGEPRIGGARRSVPPDSGDQQRRERYAVLLLAVLFMLFFSPLACQMAYVWTLVPLALALTARPPEGHPAAVFVTMGGPRPPCSAAVSSTCACSTC